MSGEESGNSSDYKGEKPKSLPSILKKSSTAARTRKSESTESKRVKQGTISFSPIFPRKPENSEAANLHTVDPPKRSSSSGVDTPKTRPEDFIHKELIEAPMKQEKIETTEPEFKLLYPGNEDSKHIRHLVITNSEDFDSKGKPLTMSTIDKAYIISAILSELLPGSKDFRVNINPLKKVNDAAADVYIEISTAAVENIIKAMEILENISKVYDADGITMPNPDKSFNTEDKKKFESTINLVSDLDTEEKQRLTLLVKSIYTLPKEGIKALTPLIDATYEAYPNSLSKPTALVKDIDEKNEQQEQEQESLINDGDGGKHEENPDQTSQHTTP